MSRRTKNNVIPITRAKAIRDTLEALHTSDNLEVIYDGAIGEFKRVIAPVIRDLLESKKSDIHFQTSLLSLLERVYAIRHTYKEESTYNEEELKEAIKKLMMT